MPVTAKLSRRFYEHFGDELATDLVDWLNAVDATYRSDLDRLNDLNFARFDAKLEQRLTQQDAKWEQRIAGLEVRWEQRMSHFEIRMEKEFAALRTDVVRWMFVFWTGTMLALAGFVFAIWKARPAP